MQGKGVVPVPTQHSCALIASQLKCKKKKKKKTLSIECKDESANQLQTASPDIKLPSESHVQSCYGVQVYSTGGGRFTMTACAIASIRDSNSQSRLDFLYKKCPKNKHCYANYCTFHHHIEQKMTSSVSQNALFLSLSLSHIWIFL